MRKVYTGSLIALAVSAAFAATSANATNMSIPDPTKGDSNLLFYVTNDAGSTYTAELSQDVAGLFTYTLGTGSTTATTNYYGDSNWSINVGADSSLVTFLSTTSGTLQWGVIAGSQTAPATTAGHSVAIATTSQPSTVVGLSKSTVTNSMLGDSTGLGYDVANLNAQSTDGSTVTGEVGATTTGIIGTAASESGTNLTFYGSGVNMAGLSLTSSSGLYAITNPNTAVSSSTSVSFLLGTLALVGTGSAMDLSFTANTSAVPLPPTVWLLGSALLGLVGVGRRRASAV
jgi:hypothetical protein